MANRSLYRAVLSSNSQNVVNGAFPGAAEDSPVPRRAKKLPFAELSAQMSPMSSMAADLHSVHLAEARTPCRKLSLSSSNGFDSPRSPYNMSPSVLSLSSEKKKRGRLSHNLSCSAHESIQESMSGVIEGFDLISSSPSKAVLSPSADKENSLKTPKDKKVAGLKCVTKRRSPLKDIGNVNRSLNFSHESYEVGKKLITTPAKKCRLPSETSPVEGDGDCSSRDSGYSESAKKLQTERLKESGVRMVSKFLLDMDSSESKSVSSISSDVNQKITCVPDAPKPSTISPDNLVSQDTNFPPELSSQESAKLPTIPASPFGEIFKNRRSEECEEDDDVLMHLSKLNDAESLESDRLGALLTNPVQINASSSSILSHPSKESSNSGPIVSSNLSIATPIRSSDHRSLRARRTLASNMDCSPCNPQARLPQRRTLSLMIPKSPDVSQQVSNGSGIPFKRPLPPVDTTPIIETKRLKPSNSCSKDKCTLKLSDLKPFDIKPLEETEFESKLERNLTYDASPELVSSRSVVNQGHVETVPFPSITGRSQSNVHLGPRQYSAPVTDRVMKPLELLARAHSENNVSIMQAIERSQHREEKLTGDFARGLALPVIHNGRHPELPSISPATLADLLRGKFKDSVESYKILDCRFPYEFEGGHIAGAESWHSPQNVADHMKSVDGKPVVSSTDESDKRNILIFHCEFSAERGPRAQRLLRELDRTANKESYPSLHFPELYLLEGGYKAFYEEFSDLCDPQSYVRMRDSEFSGELKMYRAKSKNWVNENKQSKSRTSFRRL